jgi:hypothetical protein
VSLCNSTAPFTCFHSLDGLWRGDADSDKQAEQASLKMEGTQPFTTFSQLCPPFATINSSLCSKVEGIKEKSNVLGVPTLGF